MNPELQQCSTMAQEVSMKDSIDWKQYNEQKGNETEKISIQAEYINIDREITHLEQRKKELKEKILSSCSLADCVGSKELELIKVCVYERDNKQVDHEYLKEVLHPNQYRRAVKVLTSLVSKITIKK